MAALSLDDYLSRWSRSCGPVQLRRGPVAVILIEDDAAIPETLQHHANLGFRHLLALSPEPIDLPETLAPRVTNLIFNTRRPDAHAQAVNKIIAATPTGTWLYYGYNAEFLYFPFSETRTIGELLAFHAEERRDAMLSYVVDLYAADLTRAPDAVSMGDAMFDSTGYYALSRKAADGKPLERQLNFHGGLRWRYEEHLHPDRRRIDRIALFKTAPGLRLTADHLFNIAEYNTYACPWHNNLTAAVASFRVAKALTRNPGSRDVVRDFTWRHSQAFEWRAQQLMDLGLMEPGQWF